MFAKGSAHIIVLPILLGGFFLLGGFYLWKYLYVVAFLSFIFFIILLIFFRDPERNIGSGIMAVADGNIRDVSEIREHKVVSTFMNLHNVHVNRAPLDGKVLSIERKKGSHSPAFLSKANENSSVTIMLDTEIGQVRIVQIAGVFAYRIKPYISVGQSLTKGDKIGIIRFGSRVDIYLPRDKVTLIVRVGEKVMAGSNTIARVNS